MADACKTFPLHGAYVQENGIIRLADGLYIGRLDGVAFVDIEAPSRLATALATQQPTEQAALKAAQQAGERTFTVAEVRQAVREVLEQRLRMWGVTTGVETAVEDVLRRLGVEGEGGSNP